MVADESAAKLIEKKRLAQRRGRGHGGKVQSSIFPSFLVVSFVFPPAGLRHPPTDSGEPISWRSCLLFATVNSASV